MEEGFNYVQNERLKLQGWIEKYFDRDDDLHNNFFVRRDKIGWFLVNGDGNKGYFFTDINHNMNYRIASKLYMHAEADIRDVFFDHEKSLAGFSWRKQDGKV
jgi:hypothetical protein